MPNFIDAMVKWPFQVHIIYKTVRNFILNCCRQFVNMVSELGHARYRTVKNCSASFCRGYLSLEVTHIISLIIKFSYLIMSGNMYKMTYFQALVLYSQIVKPLGLPVK